MAGPPRRREKHAGRASKTRQLSAVLRQGVDVRGRGRAGARLVQAAAQGREAIEVLGDVVGREGVELQDRAAVVGRQLLEIVGQVAALLAELVQVRARVRIEDEVAEVDQLRGGR